MNKLLDENHRPKHRGPYKPPLTIPQILAWADAYYRRSGEWPTIKSGLVCEAADENWLAIASALYHGRRGLSGGSSLRKLLGEQRGFRPRLAIEQILAWADAHRKRTGEWPTVRSGAVHGMTGELWRSIDRALSRGSRGLPSGSSLSKLLNKHRGASPSLGRRPTRAPRASEREAPSRFGLLLMR